MIKNWTIGVTSEEVKKDIITEFNTSGHLRRRLIEIAEKKKESALKNNISDKAYDNPNWAYKQADLSGYMRALDEICEFLK